MAISYNSNLLSLKAQRSVAQTGSELDRVFERLSSGMRINKAADDAAGLSVADTLNAKSRVFSRGVQNLNDGVSALAIADGALEQLTSINTRLLELAEQGSTGAYSATQRNALDREAQALSDEFSRIIQTTSFNGIKLFDGSTQDLRLQAGYGVEGSISSTLGGYTGTGLFGTASSTGTGGSEPIATQLADLNGDGILDLITLDRTDKLIKIQIGDGQGGFGAAAATPVETGAQSIALGDINNDGVLDIIVPNTTSNSFTAITINSQGGIASNVDFASAFGTSSAAIGDLNGDGFADVVVTSSAAGIAVRYGDGQGSFGAATGIATNGASNSITLGDLNGDGLLDIVTANTNATATVLLANGAGSFSAAVSYAINASATQVQLADINNDNVLDMLVSSNNASAMGTFIGTAQGTFGSASYLGGTGLAAFDIGDVNGDGILDIIGAQSGRTTSASIYLGNSQGGFSFGTSANVGTTQSSVAAGDINNDGVVDLVFSTTAGFVKLLGTTQSGVNSIGIFSLSTQADSRQALSLFQTKQNLLLTQRGQVGAFQSRLGIAVNTLQSQITEFSSAESRIRDADIASEAANLTRLQILQQAGIAILGQANQQPDIALRLLSGGVSDST